MKKIVLLLLLLSFFACKKDPIDQIINDLETVDLPQNIVGKWRWIGSVGGFGGGSLKDSTKKQLLTIEMDKRFQICINDICNTGKWAYGSRILKSSNNTSIKDTILILNFSTSFTAQTVFNAKNVNDTLVLNDNCNDCFSHTYVKSK